MNRFLRLLLCLLLMTLLALPAMAEDLEAGGFTYTVNEDGETVTITGYTTTPGGILSIPAQLDGKTVTAIGQGAFFNCSAITEIVFPTDGRLTTIETNAFQRCDSLVSVTLPEGLTTLGRESFGSCLLLRSVHIPSTLSDAGSFYGPFTNSELLRTVTFADGLETIPKHLFYGAWPETFELPDSLTAIEANAFTACENLRSITIPDGVTSIGYQAFMSCDLLTSVTLPAELETIGNQAFRNVPLTELTLSEGLISIGDYAFQNCEGLARVKIPEGVTTLGQESFGSIDTLKSVHIPSTLTDAGNYYGPFTNSPNLRKVTFGKGTDFIPSHLFYSAAIRDITLPDTLVEIGSEAFRYCDNLTSIVLPSSVTTVGNNAFRDCGALTTAVLSPALSDFGTAVFYNCTALHQIGIPEGISELPDDTFGNCTSLEAFWLPNSMRTLGDDVFSGCSALTGVYIRNGLEEIGNRAFKDCPELTQIVLPPTVTTVRGSAFRNDDNLTAAFFLGDAPTISTDHAFPSCTTLYYPEAREGWTTPFYPAATKYPTAPIWGTVPLNDQGYFATLSDHHFKFRDHTGNPITGVTVVFGEELHSSGDAAEITARFSDEAVTELTFQKDGYFPVTLPMEVLEGISVIRLYPDTWDEPFMQAAYARDTTDGAVYDLINGGVLITAGDRETTYDLYIQPNWVGLPHYYFLMSTSTKLEDSVAPLSEGWLRPVALGESLEMGDSLYILQVYNSGAGQKVTPVQAVIVEEDLDVTLDLGDAFDIPVISEELIRLLGETNTRINLNQNMNLQFKIESDGSFTMIAGAELENKNYAPTLADQLKKMADDYKDGVGNLADMWKQQTIKLEDCNVALAATACRFVFEPSFEAILCVKGKLTLDELGELKPYLTEGILAGQIKGSFTKSYPFLNNGRYFSLGFDTEHQFLLRFPKSFLGESVTPIAGNYEGKIISIVPRYGLGYDGILSAGLRGEGTVNMESSLPIKKENTTLYLSAAIYAEATVFALEADQELFYLPFEPIYTGKNVPQILSRTMNASLDSGSDWEPQSMDYLYGISLLAVDGDNTDTDVTVVATDIYPYAETQLAVLPDGTELAVWVAHGDEEPNNRTRLYYSYTEDGSWSEPAPVDGDDLTADFSPLLQVENGTAYLVWQDAGRPLTAEDDVTSMASVMDVSAACWNGEGFDLLGSFGTEFYDGAMSLTLTEGQPTVCWASNGDNDVFFGGGLTSALHRASFDGEEWFCETLAEELGAIDRTAAWNDTVWFTADAVGDGIPTDRELFCYDGELTRLTEDEVIDSKPAVLDGKLLWFRDEALTDGGETIPMAYVTDRYQYLKDGAMEALVYVANDSEQRSGIYASFNDGSGWGEPIALTAGETNIGSFSARFLPDGSLAVLTLERGAYFEDNRISYSAGTLNRYSVEIRGDLALEEVDYVPTTLLANNDLTVQLMLTNRGMAYARAVQVTVTDGETQLAQQVCQADLVSGQRGSVILNVPLGEALPQELTVSVEPIGFTDDQMEDNTAPLTLNLTDLSLDEATAVSGSGTSVTVMVTNRGQTHIDAAELTLTDENGTLLATLTVTDLPARSAKFVEFTLEQTLENNALLIVEAEEIGTENLVSNNRFAVPVQKVEAGDLTEGLSLSVTDSGVEATVVLSNVTAEAVTGNYICAAYDSDGKMLACFTELSYTTQPGKTSCLTGSLPAETATVRLFRLNSDRIPTGAVIEKAISR